MSVSEPIAVTGGLVRGIPSPLDPAITEYRAIPYAADPSGENRFKPPQPVVPWEGVRLCDTNPPINHQLPPPPPYVDPLAEVPQGEDILYLNMWTPTKPHVVDQPCPVFMWIYGGGYREGGNSDKNFDGTALAQKGGSRESYLADCKRSHCRRPKFPARVVGIPRPPRVEQRVTFWLFRQSGNIGLHPGSPVDTNEHLKLWRRP